MKNDNIHISLSLFWLDRPRKNQSEQPRPQGFSLKKWVGREKALASAGHVSPRTP